jgi:hypothetical protein
MRHVPTFRPVRLSVAFALITALMLPGVASADPPSRLTETILSVECPFIVTADGAITPFVFASDQGFSEAGIAYWATEPAPEGEEPPLLDGFTDQVTTAGLSVSTSMALFNEGAEAGSATIDATLVPIGEPEPFEERSPHFRNEGTFQAATIEGTAVLTASGILTEPISFDLSSCSGGITIQNIFEVHPSTLHERHDEARLNCELTGSDAMAIVSGFGFLFDGEPIFGFVDVFITPTDESESELAGFTQAAITYAGVDATFAVFDDASDPTGEASLSANFEPISVESARRVTQTVLQKMTLTTMAVSGSLSVETATASYEFDLSACQASYLEIHAISHDPNGPKPGGTVPANDTPDGALALEPGDTVKMQTGGASLASEEPCVIEELGGDVAFGRTVWFAVEGTDGPITIDPTGTNFDTVVAAYVSGDNGLEQVACIDDDFSTLFQAPQAALTFDTVAGTTYYVQVGGFDYGIFSEESNPDFGLLKLAVR